MITQVKQVRQKIKSRLTPGGEDRIMAHLRDLSALSAAASFEALNSRPEGLTPSEARERLDRVGPNEVHHEKAPTWYKQLGEAFLNPFIGILFVIAVVSAVMGDYETVVVVSVMVLVSALLRFFQEFRSNRAAAILKGMVRTTATVERSGRLEVDLKEVVPGDIVLLSAGDMIPADVRIIQSKDLFVSQAMLTGESLPVEKSEKDNICYMGTNVVSGTARALVVGTGNGTYFGSISKGLTGKRAETSFDKGVSKVSWLLIRFMLVMVPLVFLINGLLKHNWMEALLFGISIAVGLTPEMLPMIVTANLAKGAVNMSRRKVIVKRLNAIQNIGAMNILCTDKTGTLTMDKIVLQKHLNVLGKDDEEVMKWAYLNSYYQTGLKNLLDVAVLEHADEVHEHLKAQDFKKVDEIPFDFERRRMSVILSGRNHRHLLICKGAVEEVLGLCTHALDPEGDEVVVPMDARMREIVERTSRKLNEEGLRVLLVAIKEFDERPLTYSVADECGLILTGFIGFLDPAKPSARPSIEALLKLGIHIKVLTGDNEIVTKKICRDVGIPFQHILLGPALDFLTDEALAVELESVSILAKLSPTQKARVVRALQASGHTVGFMGDGINDAAALRDADVGISVDTAVDIAKESADIILLEKDLMVLRKGVIYGRRTFGNIIKYIKMTASSNFGNMFSMLGASALFPFLPMLPIQILVQNLLYDLSQTAIPWDRMDRDYLESPKKWDASGIARFMLWIGPVSSIFDYATFGVMLWVFHATPALFQSGWFVEGLLSQTLIVHLIRTRKIPFVQSWATAPVIFTTVLIMGVGLYLPFSPLAPALKMVPLPLAYFPWLVGILLTYCLLTQVIKTWFIRKFDQWL